MLMTVNSLEAVFMIAVVLLAIFNYMIYIKLLDYLYISAGVSRHRALEYLTYHNHDKRKLYKWLAAVAVNPSRFKKMKRLCFAPAYLAAFSVFIIMLTLQTEQILITEVYFFIELLLTVILSSLGFSCGNKAKNEFDSGLVNDAKAYETMNAEIEGGIENGKYSYLIDMFNSMFYNALPVLVIVAIFISFYAYGLISNSYKNQHDFETELTTIGFYDETNPSIIIDENAGNAVIAPNVLFEKLADEGLYCEDISGTMISTYSQYTFESCLRANGNGMSFTCYVLDNEKDAEEFCNSIVTSLTEGGIIFNTENYKINNQNVVFYANESEYGYIAVIYSDKSILHIECDDYKIEWLNTFLEDNGLLEIN